MVALACTAALGRSQPVVGQSFFFPWRYASSSSSSSSRLRSARPLPSSLSHCRLLTAPPPLRKEDSALSSQHLYSPGPDPPSGPSVLPHSHHTSSFPPKKFPSAFVGNQVLAVPKENQARLAKILSAFEAPIRFAFAYGSGVFPQEESGPEDSKQRRGIKDSETGTQKKMVDLVLAVSHPEHWHGLNKQRFPDHYSWISRLTGAEMITGWVQRLGAGLWYIPYVKMEENLVKYGVMDIDTLCDDLLDWNNLYISGRMHKPVAMLITHPRVRLAQQVNLASALRVSLLLLPETFTEVQLYTTIASLSYTGDFRMTVPGGENANKVRNIVRAQRSHFRRLYSGLIRSLGTVHVEKKREDGYYLVQDRSPEVRCAMAERLPLRLREKIMAHYLAHPEQDKAFLSLSLSTRNDQIHREPRPLSSSRPHEKQLKKKTSTTSRNASQEKFDAFWLAAVKKDDFETVLLHQIARTVKEAAWSQSVKGIYTAGLPKTMRYIAAKVGKWFEGRSEKKRKEEEQGQKEDADKSNLK